MRIAHETLDPAQAGSSLGEAEAFYAASLERLNESGIPYLVAGTYAVCAYTGISRPTKDLDVFCRAGDYPRILVNFQQAGYQSEIEDERWIAKVRRGECFFDVIFNASSAIVPVIDSWFDEQHRATIHGVDVPLVPPTELVWSKSFVQNRERFDGADVAHIILKQHENIDWKRLLAYMEPYWEVLLSHLLNFRFIYPSERDAVPRWLMKELIERIDAHAELPTPRTKVCRGRLFSGADYLVDVAEWGFADVVGKDAKS